jgi:hypothetical protein
MGQTAQFMNPIAKVEGSKMTRSFLVGTAYFSIVFAAAFALGVLRVMFVVPLVGNLLATLIELPFTLSISWFVCSWLVRTYGISTLGQAVAVGAVAFALLMCAEAVGSILLFNSTLQNHIASYFTAAGALGLTGQVAFGAFPILIYRRNITI